MTDAVVYARISDDRAGQGLGVDRQVEDCSAKATGLGWSIVETFVDNDMSASKAVVRPRYNALLDGIRSGVVKALVVYDLDRLTRKPAELEEFITLTEQHGVLLANVSGDVDLTTANGRMVARIKGAVARQEADRIAERVKRQQLQHAQSGKKHQGQHRVYGYERDFTVRDDEATVVREVFKRRAGGESLQAIATDLTDRSVATVTGRTHWDASAITKMVRRHDYVGDIAIKGEVVGKAEFDALVDRPTFDLANRKVEEANNRGNNARATLLAGFLVCGVCFTKMKSGRNQDGHLYRCPSGVPGACSSNSITGGKTDAAVFRAAWRKEQEGEPPMSDRPVRNYAAEQSVIEGELDQLREYREAGTITLTDYVDDLNRLRRRQAKLQQEEASDLSAKMDSLGHMRMLLDWDDWNLSQRRLWLNRHVSLVVVSKHDPSWPRKGYRQERLEVHFKDGEVKRLEHRVAGEQTVWGEPAPVEPPCLQDGCEAGTYSKGKCERHYKADWRKAKREANRATST